MQQRQRINSLKRKVVDSRTENAIQFQSSLTHAYVCRCDAIARDARDNKETGLNRLSKTIIGAREIGHQDQIKTEPVTGVPSPLRQDTRHMAPPEIQRSGILASASHS